MAPIQTDEQLRKLLAIEKGTRMAHVDKILTVKGNDVFTVPPLASIVDAADLMHQHGVGALLVCDGPNSVKGIISERDVVQGIARNGSDSLTAPVTSLMTHDVVCCHPTDQITDVMETMTERRIRHLPVMDGDVLVGLISIGDIVKHRIGEIQQEADELRAYIAAG
jgi:CBS domain-containing protein